MMDVNEFLEQTGIKGMKWGQRKSKTERRLSTESKQTEKVIAKAKQHGLKSLTNHELATLNKRMEMEKKFKNTIDSNPDIVKQGKKFSKEILGLELTATGVYAFYKSPPGQALKKLFDTNKNNRALMKSANALLKDVVI